MLEAQVQSLGWEALLEKGMAVHSSILAWKIPWTGSLVDYNQWDHKELDMTEATWHMGFPDGSVKRICLPMQEIWVQPLGQEDLLEKGMAAHSSIPT